MRKRRWHVQFRGAPSPLSQGGAPDALPICLRSGASVIRRRPPAGQEQHCRLQGYECASKHWMYWHVPLRMFLSCRSFLSLLFLSSFSKRSRSSTWLGERACSASTETAAFVSMDSNVLLCVEAGRESHKLCAALRCCVHTHGLRVARE